ncbi:hypothetical protein BpHYR1_000505 [Brachionus plicatilis]|uniref:Uncharacterized protein n=1 Tax=Brachionus plicatilis TaxID=10195 RepID=A0A3M7R1F6_BRAPC|nr:hypothetical protein BpHYR1_000505 [Brachionus plicatilis]
MNGEIYVTTSMIIPGLKFIETKLVVKEDDIRDQLSYTLFIKNSSSLTEMNAKNFLIDLLKSKRFKELIARARKEGIIKSHSLKKKLNFEDSENSSDEDEESIDIKKKLREDKKDRRNIGRSQQQVFQLRDFSQIRAINFGTEEIGCQ